MADPKSQSKGHIDSKNESTDKLITQNIPEINVHHKVEEGVRSSGQQQQNGTNTSAAVTLKHDGGIIGSDRQEVECHRSMSGEQEVEPHSSVSGKQVVQPHSSVSGEQEVQPHSSVSGEQEVQSHSSVSGEQEVEPHSSVSGEQVVMGDIFKAAQSGNIAMVENYLDLGFPPDLTDEEGWSILHHAASHGQVEVIKLLHERGYCIDPVDRHGRTPLHHAATSEEAASIGVLVDLGSNVNTVDSEGNTPLKWAVMCEKYSALEELLKYGGVEDVEQMYSVSVQSEDHPKHQHKGYGQPEQQHKGYGQPEQQHKGYGQPEQQHKGYGQPEQQHKGYGQPEQQHKEYGQPEQQHKGYGQPEQQHKGYGQPEQQHKGYGQPEQHNQEQYQQGAGTAAITTYKKSCELTGSDKQEVESHSSKSGILKAKVHVDRKVSPQEVGVPALTSSKVIGSTHSHRLLSGGPPVDSTDCHGNTPLHDAAAGGQVKRIKELIRKGASVDAQRKDGWTPLHAAASGNQLQAVIELCSHCKGPPVMAVCGDKGTPLHQAVKNGNKELLSILLDKGCPIDVVDSKGRNLLHWAATHNQVKMLQFLINRGVGVGATDKSGCTPLHAAAASGHEEVVLELVVIGGKEAMRVVAGSRGTPLHLAVAHGNVNVALLLLDLGCPISVVDSNGKSILHKASKYDGVELVELLVNRGVDPNIEDNKGCTPLHDAAQAGKLEAVRLLLSLGGKPSMTKVASTIGTPLHLAAANGHKQLISHLVRGGCSVDVVDSTGRSPLHHAASAGQVGVIGTLIDLGCNVNAVDSEGNTPLKWTVMCEKYSTLEELLKYGGVEDVECEQRKEPSDEQRIQEFMAALDDETVRDLLIQSASTGDVQTVSAILDHGCPVYAVDSDGYTALHRAAGGGHVEVIRELIARGASVGIQGSDGTTPLHYAAATGELEAVYELLRLGGKASMTKVAGAGGTPLHQAVLGGHKEVVLVLMDAGCPIVIVDNVGRNVLHAAARHGHVNLIGLLVERGLDVNRGDADGYTPLHYAAANGELEAVYELLRLGGKVSMTKVAGTLGTPLHLAVLGGHKEVVLVLMDAGCPIDVVDGDGRNVLHIAARGGHAISIGLMVLYGLDVNKGNVDGYTPLHLAAANGKLEAVHELLRLGGKASMTKVASTGGTPLHLAALSGHKEVVLVLLDEGCPIDVVDSNGRNVLHTAAQCGHVDLMGLLVERGLDINRGDADGYTPLHSAARNGKLVSVHELLRLGGKVSMTKVAGKYGTPLHQAVVGGHKEIVLVLLDEGCPIDVVDSIGRNVLHAATRCGHVILIGLIVLYGLDVNRGDADGYTPLHLAAVNGKLEAVCELLRLGGKPSMTKVAGKYGTPLHQAALSGHKEVVLVLLDAGCPIDVADSNGRNVLHTAVRVGHVDLMGLLVECGLDVSRGDANGYTPLHYAAANGQLEAVHELLKLVAHYVSGTKLDIAPLHTAVCKGHVDIVSALLDAMEQYRSSLISGNQGSDASLLPSHSSDGVDHANRLSQAPVDYCDNHGQTALMLAAETGQVAVFNFLLSRKSNHSARDYYELTAFEHAVMYGHTDKLTEFSTYQDSEASIIECVLALNNRNLLDPRKLLILGSFTGDPLVITTLSDDESMFSEAAGYQWPMACRIAFDAMNKESSSQLCLPDQGPLTALHIALLMFKEVRDDSTEDESIKRGAKDYVVFIEKLISHPLTKHIVNELFPNGLSPLDIAHHFDFHDVADMIERAGGGPGLWANLPKQIQPQAIGALLPLKALMSCEADGQEAASRIVAHLFGVHPSRYSESQSEESVKDKTLKKRPELRLIVKHVLPKLHHLDDWFDVGMILEVSEDELLKIQSHPYQDRVAYRTMLSTWLKHGCHVTWKNLLDAVGHFETKKTVDDMTNKIVEELAPLQVSLIVFHFQI